MILRDTVEHLQTCEICSVWLKCIQWNTNSTFHLTNQSVLSRLVSLPDMCLNVAFWHQNAECKHSCNALLEVGFSCSRSLIRLVWTADRLNRLGDQIKSWLSQEKMDNNNKKVILYKYTHTHTHYIAKHIGSPPSNERFDYFSNFHEYKS